MAEGNLKDLFGPELDDMVKSLIAEELSQRKYNVTDAYKEIVDRFDKNVEQQVPKMQVLFKQLDEDVANLEGESQKFNEELAKFSIIELEDDLEPPPLPSSLERKTVPVGVDTQKVVEEKMQTTEYTPKKLSIDQLLKYVHGGRIDAGALNIGSIVLGFYKEDWSLGTIIDVQKHRDKLKYKVRFNDTKAKSLLQVNHLACVKTFLLFGMGQIVAGSRVAANYKEDGIFSGVVAEACDRKSNRGRFLIFFDDGYAMYCSPKCVYLVYGPQTNVWNDISHKPTSDYIKSYLSTPERQMLSLKDGQTLKVEFDGEWHRARCLKVDCSLVEVLYLSDSSREWIYRGSMRLEPLFRQQNMKIHPEKPNRIARAHTGMRRAHIEIVDLTGDQTVVVDDTDSGKKQHSTSPNRREGHWEAPWARPLTIQKPTSSLTAPTRIPDSFTELTGGFDVASRIFSRFEQKKKSSASSSSSGDVIETGLQSSHVKARFSRRSSDSHKRNSDDFIDVDLYPLEINKQSQPYSAHICLPQCIAAFSNWKNKKLAGANPLMKPLLRGWTRDICRMKPGSHRSSFHVYYRSPCGRACRTMSDVERYMYECSITELDYDYFSFDHTVRTIINSTTHITTIKPPRDAKYFNSDYSKGKEDMPVSCVNEICAEAPPPMPYTKVRVPGKGVVINTKSDYMVCCDCPDNCRDRANCPCQQLTVQATSCCRGGKLKKEAGYQHKRLFSFLPTGIYECNARCKCNAQCKNRVVQKGMQCRLQLFKTQKKGWGIRCLDDIARGSFVCIYTGKIQTEKNANMEGLLNGDEYLAELDHIEVAESQKEDYNSDDSSGFDSQSNASDDENSDKLSRQRDSTDTDEDASILPERKFGAITVIGGQKKKLGYSTEPTISPAIFPENLQKRKRMVMRKSAFDKNSDNGSGLSRPSVESRDDDDTTDTDSDNDVMISRPPTARKSTTSAVVRSMEVPQDNEDEVNGTRRYFGPEGTFIIDAKQTGNLGRYLNHSCTPNLMVQNVFIDTHDLRFPWVAFFASSTIRSGTELTWDYNYEIGSVPGRVIHCYCGSTKCRKRLL